MIRKLAKGLLVALVFALALVVGILGALRIAAALRETAIAADIAPKPGRLVETTAGAIYVTEIGPARAFRSSFSTARLAGARSGRTHS